jgi:type II secretory pathway pseudopilin PulG
LTRLGPTARALRGQESGFTLVELLVGMLVGIVVMGALYAILQTTLFETSKVFSRVDTTQRSRLALENIESLMHSSCVSESVTPVQGASLTQGGSTATRLSFLSRYGGGATVTPVLHVITLSGSNLVDTTYNVATGATAPNWTFQSTAAATNTLLTNVAAPTSAPMFQYFGYDAAADSAGNPYQDEAGNPYQMLLDGTNSLPSGSYTSTGVSVPAGTVPANSPDPLPVPLSDADADATSEVLISLRVGPSAVKGLNTNLTDVYETVTDAVVLRLTPVVSDGSNNQAVTPCA